MSKPSERPSNIAQILVQSNIFHATKLTNTLQGSIWRGLWLDDCSGSTHSNTNPPQPQPVVVKVTDRSLQQASMAKIGDSTFAVHENILSEAAVLKYLTVSQDCPRSIVGFRRFFKTRDQSHYLLLMEDGGSSLFDFVVKAHRLMRMNRIAVSDWTDLVKRMLTQMIESVQYLHDKNVSHMDISMENFVINDVLVEEIQSDDDAKHASQGETVKFVLEEIQIKLVDFGLAERFADDQCLCDKWCGKTKYKSPEVVAEKTAFHAKMNDVWCLGVCLFMMSTGSSPWNKASECDDYYRLVRGGNMKRMLQAWNLQKFVDDDLLDLFAVIFRDEAHRASLQEIKSHAWLK